MKNNIRLLLLYIERYRFQWHNSPQIIQPLTNIERKVNFAIEEGKKKAI
jgi:hypothetical protein